MKKKAIIFDLDGVIVHTDHYHYLAWKAVADKEKLQFDEELNNRLRGVSRMESLHIILESNGVNLSELQKEELAEEKNELYRQYLAKMTPKDVDETVLATLQELKKKKVKIAIGSSSKNARMILERTGILELFDAISDGNNIVNSKPHPEVFIKAAEFLNLNPSECLVVEDAIAGIDAGIAGGFETAAVGDAKQYGKATYLIDEFSDLLRILKKQAFNPYLPSYEYVPDGEPYVFGDRVYIYGSHDRFNGSQYCQNNYVCWSAPIKEIGDWRYEGVIYQKMQDPTCESEDRLLFAPDVQQGADGRYYLYYAFDFSGIISVAVCDKPAGQYEFYGHVQYNDGTILGMKEGDAFHFDPGVLVDEDGKVYLYSGFCPTDFPWKHLGFEPKPINGGMVIELEKDMITVKEEPKSIFPDKLHGKGTDFEGHEFFEASSMRKIGDTYYFVYSSIHGHELCYATSKSPIGGFQYGGTIISNGDIYLNGRTEKEALNYTGNNHGSIVEINDKWYVFYHRQTNKHQFSRQVCAEEIQIEKDGRIQQVEMTSCGLNGGPLSGKGEYEARIACNLRSKAGTVRYEFGQEVDGIHPYFTQEGEDREDQPGQYIANMTNGAVAGFKYFAIQDTKEIVIKVRGDGQGELRVSTSIGSDLVAQVFVYPSREWNVFRAPLQVENGVKALYFTYFGSGAIDFYSFELK